MPAAEVDAFLGPEPVDQRHGFVQATPALLRRDAERGELLGRVAGAHAENQAAAGDDVDHRRFLGDGERMVERQEQHAGPEAHPARSRRDRGEADERRRIEQDAVVMLAEPHRVESCRLGALALRDRRVEVAAALERTQTEFHDSGHGSNRR